MHLPANLKLFYGGAWHEPHGGYAAGCIGINSMAFHSVGSPFGGYKQSGIGREECLEELLEFTQLKSYAVGLVT
jgi:betaine-aldehyde dehydrogenase